jgi:hypothetical protein
MKSALVLLAVVVVASVAAQDADDVIPESLIEELASEAPQSAPVTITRDCFERTCGDSGCNLAKMPCGGEAVVPWAVFLAPDTQESKLVSVDTLKKHAPGLVDIVEHKKPLDPNVAISMPGVPAEASAHLLKAMKKQDGLLKHIVKMEKYEMKHDPLHRATRSKWLGLAATIKHMSPGPEKMKSQIMLLKLAKELADKEKAEQKKEKKIAASSPDKHVSPATVKKLMKAIMDKSDHDLAAKTQQPAKKTMDGLPVSNRKCFQRGCINKMPNGDCAIAVISCGHDGKAPSHIGKLTKKQAIKALKKNMSVMAPLIKGMTHN